jgi:predicted secreted protein
MAHLYTKIIFVFILLLGNVVLAIGYHPMSEKKSSQTDNLVDSTKPILLTKAKPYFTVALDSNPSTGYEWIYEPEHSNHLFIESIHSHYQSATNKRMGAPGKMMFTFRFKPSAFDLASTFKITLLYTRAWERDPLDIKRKIEVATFIK